MPIGTFEALRHRIVDLHVDLEQVSHASRRLTVLPRSPEVSVHF